MNHDPIQLEWDAAHSNTYLLKRNMRLRIMVVFNTSKMKEELIQSTHPKLEQK